MKNEELEKIIEKEQFRGKDFRRVIKVLFELYNVIDYDDLYKGKKNKKIKIRNKNSEEIGKLYIRKYNDLEKENFSLEIMLKKDKLDEGREFLDSVTTLCGGANLEIVPEENRDIVILVWQNSENRDDLIKKLIEEYGGKSDVYDLGNAYKFIEGEMGKRKIKVS